MKLNFSIIIPVYNRPQEIDELLQSLTQQNFKEDFQVIVVEDGSENKCDEVVANYRKKLNIFYFLKENSGAGKSRNYGMQQANGNYFIILDSDVILPKNYLSEVLNVLKNNFTDAFGGPDAAHKNFSNLQKAINYTMTSFFTTGGIRGKKKTIGKFQPRSFNMGLSKEAYLKTNGFADLKTGEDIDLTFRLWQQNFKTQLIEKAFVYHKRRTSIKQFFKQTFAFGTARPKLNKRYPKTAKLTYWFPSVFSIGLFFSLILVFLGNPYFIACYVFYFCVLFFDALYKNGFWIAFLSIYVAVIQFFGYGLGFLQAQVFRDK